MGKFWFVMIGITNLTLRRASLIREGNGEECVSRERLRGKGSRGRLEWIETSCVGTIVVWFRRIVIPDGF